MRVKRFEISACAVLAACVVGCGGGTLQRDGSAKGGNDGQIMTGMGGGGAEADGGGDAGGAGGGVIGVPIVGPEREVDAPFPASIPGVGTDASVAFSGSEYFIVWNDDRAQFFGQAIGTRVGLDGRVLDPDGILISEITGESSDPSVVWDGTNYLVVYERAGTIVGRRFAPSGAIVDPQSFSISGQPDGSHSPFAVANGATTLVAWANVDTNTNPSGDNIVGARVTGSTVQDASPIAIGRNDGRAYTRAAFGGGNWLVCWQTEDVNRTFLSDSVLCARVEGSTGALLDQTAIHVADGTPGEQNQTYMRNPWVASDGSDYLVVYERTFGYQNPAAFVAARITSDGVVLDSSGIQIGAAPDYDSSACVAFAAGHYEVVWQPTSYDPYTPGQAPPIVYGNRFDASSGSALDGPTGAPIAGVVGSQQPPRIFAAGSAFYITFTSPDPERGLVGSRLSADPALLDIPAVPLVSRSSNHQGQPAIASDGTNYFAVWVDNRGGSNVIYGARIDGKSGVSLNPVGIQVSPSAADASDPSVAFNGTNYLVVWAVNAGMPPGFYGARIAPDGTNLDPAGLPLFLNPNPDFYFPPRTGIASDGTNWLLAWGEDSYAHASRIAPDGVLMDPASLVVAPQTNGAWNPAVAYGDGNYLVIWTTDNNDVVGSRISSAGKTLASNISLESAPTNGQPTFAPQRRLGLAYGAGAFLASNANAHGLGQLALARDGGGSAVLLDCCASDSAIAYDGGSFILAYAVPTPYATYDIKASRFDPSVASPSIATDRDAIDWDIVTGGVATSDGLALATANGRTLAVYVRYDATLGANRVRTRLIETP